MLDWSLKVIDVCAPLSDMCMVVMFITQLECPLKVACKAERRILHTYIYIMTSLWAIYGLHIWAILMASIV